MMSTGRLRIRSHQAPAGRPITRNAAVCSATSTPTWNVVAESAVIATSGTASTPICEPSWLSESPIHSRRKSRWCHNPPSTMRF
jgi:hypothetical protein